MRFRRVLVAVDESPIAAHAAEVGAAIARDLGAELAFVHVLGPFPNPPLETLVTEDQLMAESSLEAKGLLARLREHVSAKPTPLEFVRVGKAAPEILATAREWPADMVVIGSHGRGGVQRLALGSVAEAVMRKARCPVLVVRAQE